jgi:dienelactone hydrolase
LKIVQTTYFDYLSKVHLCVAVKLGVGGFSMGAATALYSASCFTAGKYGNGSAYLANISAAVGLSGWLPCSKYVVILL